MPKILSLGQCAADDYNLTEFLTSHFDADVVPVDTFTDAADELEKGHFDLVLVNRILDRNGAAGLDFIAQVKKNNKFASLRIMMISNFAEAQRQAVSLGALPGFGKNALHQPKTIALLKAALAVGD